MRQNNCEKTNTGRTVGWKLPLDSAGVLDVAYCKRKNYFTEAVMSFFSAMTSLSCSYIGLYFPLGISLNM